jgi:hypothetical protein
LRITAYQKLNTHTALPLTQYVEGPIVFDVWVCDLDVLDERLGSDKLLLRAMDHGVDSPKVLDGVLQ